MMARRITAEAIGTAFLLAAVVGSGILRKPPMLSWYLMRPSRRPFMTNEKRVLILRTGNSARSQMAEGLLRHDAGKQFGKRRYKGQLRPARSNSRHGEVGIDISGHRSKQVAEFAGQDFDYVITVCDNARETYPVFFGKAEKLHHDFEDPAALMGSDEQRLATFRRVRDQLREYLTEFSKSVS
jgi:arsenate reductase